MSTLLNPLHHWSCHVVFIYLSFSYRFFRRCSVFQLKNISCFILEKLLKHTYKTYFTCSPLVSIHTLYPTISKHSIISIPETYHHTLYVTPATLYSNMYINILYSKPCSYFLLWLRCSSSSHVWRIGNKMSRKSHLNQRI